MKGDKSAAQHIENALLTIVRDFLSEFKTEHAINQLNLNASLERDLGIDSLGRVELFLRIEKSFSIQFEGNLMIEADTLKDIAIAIQKAGPVQKNVLNLFTTPLEKTLWDPTSAQTLTEVLIKRAEIEPNRPHIYLQNEYGQEQIIRYGQLLKEANQVAAGLYAEGLKPGQTVAIMLPTSADFFYAFLGILLAGGIPVPIYPPLRPNRIEEYALREAVILNNAEVRILITIDKTEALAKLLRAFIKSLKTVTTVDALLKTQNQAPTVSYQSHDPALIQYTSGSTSHPKGVLLSHYNLLSNIRALGNAIHLGPTDVCVSWLPLYHDMGLIGSWLGSLYHAFPLVLFSPSVFISQPERWLWALHYHRGTVSAAPNFAYELCIRKIEESTIQGLDLSTWRLALNGAEAVYPKTLERFIKKFEPYGFKADALKPIYGLAESAVALVAPVLDRGPKIDIILREPFEKTHKAISVKIDNREKSHDYLEFVSCGKPIPNHEIRIVNEKGQVLGEREVGSLFFRGPSTMIGYYQNTEATEAIYSDGWWDSGDYAYIAEDEVFITGRKKDIIIKAGRNLYPQEIEAITAEAHGVRKGCVIAFGAKDSKLGTEKLVVVAETLETKADLRNQMISEIIEKIAIKLGIPPDQVILVPPKTLPKTSSGKLQRALCKQFYLAGTLTQRELPVQLQLVKLFLKSLMIRFSQTLKRIGDFLYTGYFAILVSCFTPIIYAAITLLSPTTAAIVSRYLVKALFKCSLVPIKIKGLKNIRQEAHKRHPYIFVVNHTSTIDSVLLFSILPLSTTFVCKKELLDWPVIGKAIKKFKYPIIDQADFAKSLNELEKMKKILEQGRNLVIFPEGTFTEAVGLRPFKLGAFKLAVDTNTPIYPTALAGTRSFLRDNKRILHWNPINITFSEPILPNLDHSSWEEMIRLNRLTRKAIAKHSGELSIDTIDTSLPSNSIEHLD